MTTGTNLQLTYDESTDSWSYQNVDYEYPANTGNSWSGFTSPDPDFEFVPNEPSSSQPDANTDPCPAGYIYDDVLKQCVPDPNYRAPSYYGEPEPDPNQGDPNRDNPQANYVDFRNMSYDEMVEFGKNEGYFNDAGVFIGAPDSTVPFLGIRALAQFGENSQANRFAINFAQKGGKVYNPNLPFKGNLYIPKPIQESVDNFGQIINEDSFNKFKNLYASDSDVDGYEIVDTKIKEEKLKQEQIKTEKAKQEFAEMQETKKGDTIVDKNTGDTYTKVTDNQTGGGGSQGFTFTPKDPKPVTTKDYQNPFGNMDRAVKVGPRAGIMAPQPTPTGPNLTNR